MISHTHHPYFFWGAKHISIKIKAKADKKGIKDDAKSDEHYMPTYAKLVTNKSITIK